MTQVFDAGLEAFQHAGFKMMDIAQRAKEIFGRSGHVCLPILSFEAKLTQTG
jgi:hypothetical protein